MQYALHSGMLVWHFGKFNCNNIDWSDVSRSTTYFRKPNITYDRRRIRANISTNYTFLWRAPE